MGNYTEEMPGPADCVWLEPEGLTQGVSLPDAYLLILREKGGGRHLPLLLDRDGFSLLLRATKHHEYPETRLMGKLAQAFGIRLDYARIQCADTGRYYTTLCFGQTGNGATEERQLDVSLAQGIVAAMEAGRPVCIGRHDFERLYNRQKAHGQVRVPIASMGNDLLREALKLAVENDNFELASQLRDELRGRDAATPETPAEGGQDTD